MRVYLEAQGCRVNEAERASWSRALEARGHSVVFDPTEAQVVVLNTCAVTHSAGRKARRALGRLRSRCPRAVLVATGCWSTLETEVPADLVVPNTEKDLLVDRLEALRDLPALDDGTSPIAAAPRTRAFVKVQDGCRNRCTFCVVTIARGEERSRSIEAVVDEVNQLASHGFQEVVLTGIHLGGFGSDQGSDLRQLVAAILERTTIPRLRLSSLEPWDLPPGFFELWDDPRLCPHLHLPLQSGSDAVLKRMARRTTRDSFRRLIDNARANVPAFAFTTDVMAGFPFETDADFQQTVDLLTELKPAGLHVFSYSPRAGTAASRFEQLPSHVRQARAQELRELGNSLSTSACRAAFGTSRPVLWERRPRIGAGGKLSWRGHTDTYLRVKVETPFQARIGNRVVLTKLTGLKDGVLLGQLWTEKGIGPHEAGR